MSDYSGASEGVQGLSLSGSYQVDLPFPRELMTDDSWPETAISVKLSVSAYSIQFSEYVRLRLDLYK